MIHGNHVLLRAAATCFAIVNLCRLAAAQTVEYSALDAATVRVFALGPPALASVSHGSQQLHIGIPLAGHGSGVLVDQAGLVLTAAHVVKDARVLAVQFPGMEDPVVAKVVHADDEHDIALIQVPSQSRETPKLCPADTVLHTRQGVFAVGYPLDSSRDDPQSSKGIISARLANGNFQLDISVNPGNSGGPIITDGDEVCGIVVARAETESGRAAGIAVAVPAATIREQLEQLTMSGLPDLVTTEEQQTLAKLVAAMSAAGPEWFEASLELGEHGGTEDLGVSEAEVELVAEHSPASADAQVLASVYLWNRFMSRVARRGDPGTLQERALQYARKAAGLDGELSKESAYLEYVLDEGAGVDAPKPRINRKHYHDGFYFRTSAGYGVMSWQRWSDLPARSEAFVPWEVLVGGGRRFTYGFAGSGFFGTGSMTGGIAVGAFGHIYPWLDDGWSVQLRAQLLFGQAKSQRPESYSASEDFGFGTLALGGGYDWWIGDQWAVGVAGSVAALIGMSNEPTQWMPRITAGFAYH